MLVRVIISQVNNGNWVFLCRIICKRITQLCRPCICRPLFHFFSSFVFKALVDNVLHVCMRVSGIHKHVQSDNLTPVCKERGRKQTCTKYFEIITFLSSRILYQLSGLPNGYRRDPWRNRRQHTCEIIYSFFLACSTPETANRPVNISASSRNVM